MKINFTLFFSIILATGIVAAGFTFFQASKEKTRLSEELMARSSQISDELTKNLSLTGFNETGDPRVLERNARLLCRKYRLMGIAYYVDVDSVLFSSPAVRRFLDKSGEGILRSVNLDSTTGKFFRAQGLYLHQYIRPLKDGNVSNKAVVVYTETGYVQRDILDIWLNNTIR